ncbi:MAG: GyrI-like domain-containing protein [Candidatus Hodarchaeales archaeon]
MAKIDYKKKFKDFYQPKANVVSVVDVPAFNFLMIDGKGYPGTSQEYQDAMATIYPISYTLKFMMKKKGKDYVVMPLEGLWWADDMTVFTTEFMERKEEWKWTSLVMQPEFVTEEMVKEAIAEIEAKGKELPSLSRIRFESYLEGKSAQIMYFGPYSEEGPTIQKIHDYIKELGGHFDGLKNKHHEIYLSDPRRTKPERLKTIIRQPFE